MIEELLERAEPEPNTGCWIWLGSRDHKGYAVVYPKDGTIRRVSRMILGLPHAPRLTVTTPRALHRCDLTPCIWPGHLYIGTQAENARDREERRRRHAPCGEHHGMSKFTSEQVQLIRDRVARGDKKNRIARDVGCSPCTISDIIYGRTRRHG